MTKPKPEASPADPPDEREIRFTGGGDIQRGAEAKPDERQVYTASFSSEQEEELWSGILRVLEHGDGCVDLSFANDGANIFYNHNRNEVIGKIKRAWIDKETRRGMCEFTFARGRRAEEVKMWVDDGDLSRTSVGGEALESVIEERKDGKRVKRVTKWKVTEVSLVSIPADDTVGIGRAKQVSESQEPDSSGGNIQKGDNQMSKENENKPASSEPTITVAESQEAIAKAKAEAAAEGGKDAIAKEKERMEGIDAAAALATQLKADEVMKMTREARRDGTSPTEFSQKLFERIGEITKQDPSALNDPSRIGLSKKETLRFSIAKALGNFYNKELVSDADAGFERECIKATVARSHHGGMVLPFEIMADRHDIRRAQGTDTDAKGAALVAEEHRPQSFIENLRDMSQVMRAGVTLLPGLTGNIEIPRKTSSATYSFKAKAADTGDTTLGFDQVKLAMKSASGAVAYSREMILQATPAIDGVILRDLVWGAGLLFDEAVLAGTGANNQPKGIMATTGVNAETYTTANGMTYAEVLDCITSLESDNALQPSAAWFMTPAHKNLLRRQPLVPVTGTDAAAYPHFVLTGNGNLVDYPVYAKTTAMTNAKTILGVFSEVLVGAWNLLEIQRDTAELSKSGGIVLRAWVDMDVAVRHPQSFCVATGS